LDQENSDEEDQPLPNCYCTITVDTFSESVKAFVKTLRSLAPKSESLVTPYLHSMAYHVPDMLNKYLSLRQFSCSAQELKNAIQTLVQFRASNQHDIPRDLSLYQLCSLWFSAHPEL
jgi:hypothetical protein